MLAIVFALLIIFNGTLATYLFERRAPFAARVAMGIVIGFVALSHVAFLLFCALGLNTFSLFVLFAIAGACGWILWRRYSALLSIDGREFVASFSRRELWPTRFFLLLLFGVLGMVFRRVMYEREDGIYTGFVNNLGDMPLHLQIIGSFAHENNFPPQNPIFHGVRFSYPFMADFLTAIWLRLGLNIEYSMLGQNLLLMIASVLLLRHFAWRLLRDRVAVALTPWLLLFSGGLGWMLLLKEARDTPQGLQGGLFGLISQPIHYYTKHDEANLQWGNAIATLFVTQRNLILAVPIAVLVAILWWNCLPQRQTKIDEDRVLEVGDIDSKSEIDDICLSRNRMMTAGVLVGALPLIHAHFFAALVGIAFLLTLMFRAGWVRFWIPAIVLSIPQLWWLVGGDNQPTNAFGWQPGWMSQTNIVTFWWRNAGLFIPLSLAIWLWAWLRFKNGRDAVLGFQHLNFYAPFLVVGFLLPNLFRLAPWEWDNTKVFLVWWIFSCPFVALFLSWLWNGAKSNGARWKTARKAITIACFFALTFAGALDSWRGVSSNSAAGTQNSETRLYGRGEIDVAQFLQTLPAGGVFLHAPTYNSTASLAGKMSVMGYNGHLGSYGISYQEREADLINFFSGAAGSENIPAKYGARYIVVGAQERDHLRAPHINRDIAPNTFWKQWKEVKRIGEYSIYQTQK